MKHCHESSSRDWQLLKKLRSEVRGQGYSEAERTFPTETHPSTYGRPSVLRAAEAYRSTA